MTEECRTCVVRGASKYGCKECEDRGRELQKKEDIEEHINPLLKMLDEEKHKTEVASMNVFGMPNKEQAKLEGRKEALEEVYELAVFSRKGNSWDYFFNELRKKS